jgi:hypothetical protein
MQPRALSLDFRSIAVATKAVALRTIRHSNEACDVRKGGLRKQGAGRAARRRSGSSDAAQRCRSNSRAVTARSVSHQAWNGSAPALVIPEPCSWYRTSISPAGMTVGLRGKLASADERFRTSAASELTCASATDQRPGIPRAHDRNATKGVASSPRTRATPLATLR